jgi:hypothetical protein
MGVYSWPYQREEQIAVCKKLANISFVNYNDKKECERIAQELGRYKQPTVSEKSFIENLIRKHGSNL